MKSIRCLAVLMVLAVSGCASVNYGGLKIRSIGTDITFDKAQWVKTYTNGEVEAVYIDGAKRDATTSTHTAANVVMTVLGLAAGASTGGASTVVAGGIGGLSISEMWQTVQDMLKAKQQQPAATNTAPVVTPPSIKRTPFKSGTSHEVIVTDLPGQTDVRGLVNWDWPGGDVTHLTANQIKDMTSISGDTMTVVEKSYGGQALKYMGFRQPHTVSDLVTNNPAKIGKGTLRLVFECNE